MTGKTNAVSGKPTQTKTVEFNPGSANGISIIPDDGYLLSGVEVGKPATMIPENIKSGVDIGGVVGTFKGGVDTSDATATSNDILLGKTAYANNEKITGTIPTYNNEHENGYVQVNTLKKLLDTTKSTNYLFYYYNGTSVDDIISYNDTENVTGMAHMFESCYNIMDIPLLNTIKVKDMIYLFYNCKALTTIPLLNTSSVKYMEYMFYNCSKLTEVPAFVVSNVTSFTMTFFGCTSLSSIHMTGMKASFDISASTQFTDNDLHEIIDNLATVTSTQTLTMGATNLAKVKDVYIEKAANKGWTLA